MMNDFLQYVDLGRRNLFLDLIDLLHSPFHTQPHLSDNDIPTSECIQDTVDRFQRAFSPRNSKAIRSPFPKFLLQKDNRFPLVEKQVLDNKFWEQLGNIGVCERWSDFYKSLMDHTESPLLGYGSLVDSSFLLLYFLHFMTSEETRQHSWTSKVVVRLSNMPPTRELKVWQEAFLNRSLRLSLQNTEAYPETVALVELMEFIRLSAKGEFALMFPQKEPGQVVRNPASVELFGLWLAKTCDSFEFWGQVSTAVGLASLHCLNMFKFYIPPAWLTKSLVDFAVTEFGFRVIPNVKDTAYFLSHHTGNAALLDLIDLIHFCAGSSQGRFKETTISNLRQFVEAVDIFVSSSDSLQREKEFWTSLKVGMLHLSDFLSYEELHTALKESINDSILKIFRKNTVPFVSFSAAESYRLFRNLTSFIASSMSNITLLFSSLCISCTFEKETQTYEYNHLYGVYKAFKNGSFLRDQNGSNFTGKSILRSLQRDLAASTSDIVRLLCSCGIIGFISSSAFDDPQSKALIPLYSSVVVSAIDGLIKRRGYFLNSEKESFLLSIPSFYVATYLKKSLSQSQLDVIFSSTVDTICCTNARLAIRISEDDNSGPYSNLFNAEVGPLAKASRDMLCDRLCSPHVVFQSLVSVDGNSAKCLENSEVARRAQIQFLEDDESSKRDEMYKRVFFTFNLLMDGFSEYFKPTSKPSPLLSLHVNFEVILSTMISIWGNISFLSKAFDPSLFPLYKTHLETLEKTSIRLSSAEGKFPSFLLRSICSSTAWREAASQQLDPHSHLVMKLVFEIRFASNIIRFYDDDDDGTFLPLCYNYAAKMDFPQLFFACQDALVKIVDSRLSQTIQTLWYCPELHVTLLREKLRHPNLSVSTDSIRSSFLAIARATNFPAQIPSKSLDKCLLDDDRERDIQQLFLQGLGHLFDVIESKEDDSLVEELLCSVIDVTPYLPTFCFSEYIDQVLDVIIKCGTKSTIPVLKQRLFSCLGANLEESKRLISAKKYLGHSIQSKL
jgi:hypothetical protein